MASTEADAMILGDDATLLDNDSEDEKSNDVDFATAFKKKKAGKKNPTSGNPKGKGKGKATSKGRSKN